MTKIVNVPTKFEDFGENTKKLASLVKEPYSPPGLINPAKLIETDIEKERDNATCILEPMPGQVIIKPDKPPQEVGRILIPKKYQRLPTIGEVIKVGDGVKHLHVGDRVFYTLMSGTIAMFANYPVWWILAESEILAKITTKAPLEVVDSAVASE